MMREPPQLKDVLSDFRSLAQAGTDFAARLDDASKVPRKAGRKALGTVAELKICLPCGAVAAQLAVLVLHGLAHFKKAQKALRSSWSLR